jgi:tight adherence protein C
VVAEVTIGTSLSVALNNVAARIGTNEANAVFSTLAQSLEMGTSVAENLQSAAQLIRHSARVRAQAQAQKAVVNMSFPLLLLILPGIFIVLFAPLVIQYVNR